MSHAHKVLKVVILGESGVGKTALLERFVNKRFSGQFKSTIGADFLMQEVVVDGKMVTLQIWDTAGTERFSSLGRVYYRGADCCLLVFDVTDPRSLEHLKFWKSEFAMYCGVPEDYPFFVLANKVDLPDRTVTKEDAKKWCTENGIEAAHLLETSSKTGQNVELAFTSAAQAIKARYTFTPQIVKHKEVNLSEQPTYENDDCTC